MYIIFIIIIYNSDAAWEKGPYLIFLLNENSCNEYEVMYSM